MKSSKIHKPGTIYGARHKAGMLAEGGVLAVLRKRGRNQSPATEILISRDVAAQFEIAMGDRLGIGRLADGRWMLVEAQHGAKVVARGKDCAVTCNTLSMLCKMARAEIHEDAIVFAPETFGAPDEKIDRIPNEDIRPQAAGRDNTAGSTARKARKRTGRATSR